MSTSQVPTDDELRHRFHRFSEELTVDVGSLDTIESRSRSRRTRRRIAAGVAATAAVAVGSVLAFSLLGGPSTTRQDVPIAEVASMFQHFVVFDFDPLAATGQSLNDVLESSAVAGRGQIVDARLGYSIEHGVFSDGTRDLERRLLVVIKPEELSKGQDQLGPSGLVYVSVPWSDAYDLETFKASVTSTSDKVAFFLTPVVFESWQKVVDEFTGREKDDPVYWSTHPSSLLGIDSANGVAMPLLTDELIEATPANLEAMDSVGAPLSGFTTAPAAIEGVPDPDHPDEDKAPSAVDSE
jgi:hypothetical protein